MNRAQRRKAKSESRRRPADRYGYIVFSSDDLVARPPPDLAEALKAAGINPNIPFNGLPSLWKKDDAAWFEAHPQRAHRVRDRFPQERFKREPSDLPNAVISKIIVRQIRAGFRVKAALIVKECSEPDVIGLTRGLLDVAEREESVAHALFDSTQNDARLVNFDQLLVRIEQYESAAARAAS